MCPFWPTATWRRRRRCASEHGYLLHHYRHADNVEEERRIDMRNRATFLTFLVVLALLAACAPQPTVPPEATVPPPPEETVAPAAVPEDTPTPEPADERQGGTFVMASADDAQYLSPFHPDVRVDRALQENLFEGLLAVDYTFGVRNVLAESYEVSDDGLVWTFDLRPGVTFHDGSDFAAEDVKYTFEWAMDPENGAATSALFGEVEGVEAVDDLTVVVTLKTPFAPFVRRTAVHGIVPSDYHSSVGPDEFNKQPVGTGPYKFKEWQPGNFLTLERFGGYWGDAAYIDEIEMRPMPEDSVRAIALRTGEAHTSVWPLTPDDTLDLLGDSGLVGYRAPGIQLSHIQMNNANPLFQDKRVRQAMMYALDRQTMVDDIMVGLAGIANTNLSSALPDHEPDVQTYDYDPAMAQTLLADAGWSAGADGILVNSAGDRLEVTILVLQGDEIRGPQAELAVSNYADVGIDLNIERNEIGTFVERVFETGEYDLAFYNWPYGGTNGDPDCYAQLACDGSDNKSGWCNEDATGLLQEARTTIDPDQRTELYSEFQKIFAEEVPFLYVMHWEDVLFMSAELEGMPAAEEVSMPLAVVWDLDRFWFGSE
jgi:peptide/nickel transport system substrate-binding protein